MYTESQAIDESKLFEDGFDQGFSLALGMVFDYVKSRGAINEKNAVDVMNLIARRRAG